MVNTKVIRHPSQSPSLLSSPLPLSPPPSFLSLLSLSSSRYPKFSNSLSLSLSSLSLTLAPPPPVSLPEPDTHRTAFFFFLLSPPQFSIPNSSFSLCASLYFSILSALYLVCYSLGRFSIAFAAAAASGGASIGFDSPRTFGFAGVPHWRCIFLISCFDK